jgi:DHA1 family inner membrane transport protein
VSWTRPRTPHSRLSLNIGAFNLGNALSAWLGGIVIAAPRTRLHRPQLGRRALAASAFGLAVLSHHLERRTTSRVIAASIPDAAAVTAGQR